MTLRVIHGAGVLLAAAFLWAPQPASAQWLASGELDVAIPVDGWVKDAFGPGAGGSAAIHRGLTPWLLVGVRLRASFLSDGPTPTRVGVADPGAGDLYTGTLAVRLRWPGDDGRLGTGPYLEGSGGAGLTGGNVRPVVGVSIGWGFDLGSFALGPVARFLQVIQPTQDDVVDNSDARIVLLGVELSFLDEPDEPPPPPEPEEPEPQDRDHDGILDADDACPDAPEDFDGFEDEDGCPEDDNDQDGLPDIEDECPLDPEDLDGFMDEDGCPDPDNDGDGVLDADDACPTELEVVNGVEDNDGCPDEGLIEMVQDRIVLDERVLFDSDRWSIRPRAYAILEAIVELWRLHPEWTLVRVEGHADYRGREDWNVRLSQRRADAVARFLQNLGMPEEIMESEGFGSARPFGPGYGSRALQRNRRVEFVVVERNNEESGQ